VRDCRLIPLGPIVRLQVQVTSLKIGDGARQRFDPSGVRSIEQVELDDGGTWGIAADGARLADVHHRDHPQSKNRGTLNGISVGFTGHYAAMRDRFGDHLTPGAAAESILIEHDGIITAPELVNGIVIQNRAGQVIHLVEFAVADPCAPFSRHALQFPDDQRPDRSVTEALQFLSDGMRGYYCRYVGPPVRVAVGDVAFVPA
jgi:hypothetical protein